MVSHRARMILADRLTSYCAAWLAGPRNPGTEQSFDVWVAFELPSFETYSTPKPPTNIAAGRYVVIEPPNGYSLGVKGLDATDGAHVLAFPPPLTKGQRVSPRHSHISVSYLRYCVMPRSGMSTASQGPISTSSPTLSLGPCCARSGPPLTDSASSGPTLQPTWV